MPQKFGNIPNLAALEADWDTARPVVRLALKRISDALRQLTVGQNPLGSGTTVTNIGGIGGGGGDVSINQVHENDAVNSQELGILVFGRGTSDNLAHAIRVNSSGEILIAELPGTTLAAGYSQSQAVPSFISYIGVIPYGIRELSGPDSENIGRMTVGQYRQYNLGTENDENNLDGDNGLCTMDSPKVNARVFNEFNGSYYAGGVGTSVVMSSGSHNSGAQLGVHRFRRGVIALRGGHNGTAPGTIQIRLFGAAGVGSTTYLLKIWEFDDTSWRDGVFNSIVLRFDVEMPFIQIGVLVSGSPDVSNNFVISNFRMMFQS